MKEVLLEGLAKHVEDATIQTWFFEEGDLVNEGDDLVELSSEEGTVMITAPSSGVLAEVYFDEGELVAKGEPICTIDDNESEDEEDDVDDKEKDDDEDEEEEEVK